MPVSILIQPCSLSMTLLAGEEIYSNFVERIIDGRPIIDSFPLGRVPGMPLRKEEKKASG